MSRKKEVYALITHTDMMPYALIHNDHSRVKLCKPRKLLQSREARRSNSMLIAITTPRHLSSTPHKTLRECQPRPGQVCTAHHWLHSKQTSTYISATERYAPAHDKPYVASLTRKLTDPTPIHRQREAVFPHHTLDTRSNRIKPDSHGDFSAKFVWKHAFVASFQLNNQSPSWFC